jgi:DNA-binding CsgD family transcriptional regulator
MAATASRISPKSVKALYDEAETLGMHGGADLAFEASLRAFEQAKLTGDLDLPPMVLEQLIRHAWAAARYPEALPIAEAYVRNRTSRTASPYDLSALLLYAHLLATIGHVEEALAVIDETESLDMHVSLDDFVRLLHERAFAVMQLGFEDSATALFRRAAELARRRTNPHLTAQALNNFAVHARYSGRIDEALQLHAEVTEFARQMHINWRVQYYLVSHGLTQYFAGRLDRAYALLMEASRDPALSRQVEIARSTLGLLLGIVMGRSELVELYCSESNLDAAFESNEPFRITNTLSAMHRYYMQSRRKEEAQAVLDRAESVIGNPYCCSLLYVEIAAHGKGRILDRSIENNGRISHQSQLRFAFDKLLRARSLQLRGEKNALHEADRAALAFEQLKWPLHRAAALEGAGRYREAANVYASCQAHAEARRVRAIRRASGRPRRFSGQLTTREWEVAKLCLDGLRNHEIASRLGVSVGTVEFHMRNVLHELDLTSRYELRDALTEL